MQKINNEIDFFIEKNKICIYGYLDNLISIKSISVEDKDNKPFGKGCKDIADKIMNIGEALGFEVENHNYFGVSILMGKKEKEIAVLTHLDVVPEGEGWDCPPYQLTIKDDLLYGRGVLDDKGPTLMALYAMKFLMENTIKLNYTFRLFMGCSEEKDMRCIEYYIKNVKQPIFAFSPDGKFPVCAGEKGIIDLELQLDCPKEIIGIKGGSALNIVAGTCEIIMDSSVVMKNRCDHIEGINVCGSRIRAKGKAAHGGKPGEGINAIELAIRYIKQAYVLATKSNETLDDLLGLCDITGQGFGINEYKDKTGETTSSLGLICVEDNQLCLGFNIRYPVKCKSEHIQNKILGRIDDLGWKVTKNIDNKPSYVDVKNPEIVALTKAIESVTGKKEVPYYSSGGTYARKLENAVAFGPDLTPKNFGGVHTANECMYEKDFVAGIKVYIYSLLRLNDIEL